MERQTLFTRSSAYFLKKRLAGLFLLMDEAYMPYRTVFIRSAAAHSWYLGTVVPSV